MVAWPGRLIDQVGVGVSPIPVSVSLMYTVASGSGTFGIDDEGSIPTCTGSPPLVDSFIFIFFNLFLPY